MKKYVKTPAGYGLLYPNSRPNFVNILERTREGLITEKIYSAEEVAGYTEVTEGEYKAFTRAWPVPVFYISGKITGLKFEEAELNFLAAQAEIRKRFPGAGFINPMAFYLGADGTWERYMEIDLEILEKHANAIFMLSNYTDSKGALEELEKAKKLNFRIEYQCSTY